MIQAKSIIAAIILLSLVAELANSQTCSYMWDPVFETNSANPPPMCAVSTAGGSSCVFPFNYDGVSSVQEPGNQTTQDVFVIARLVLVTPPSSCRLQSPSDVQPVLVAYNSSGYVIDKLGSNDQPWQVVATVISPAGVSVIGAIANYSQGQTQYTDFGLTSTGSVQVQFSFISPYGVVASFVTAINLIASSPSVSVGSAVLSAQQYIDVDVVSVNQTFNLTSIIVDKISNKKVGNIQWGTFTWSATASLYTAIQYQSTGQLVASSTSAVVIDTTGGTITITDLAINTWGMYIVKLEIISSDNVYSITITSNAILVKNQTTVLYTYTGPPPANFTYDLDYYALVSGGRLEIMRCTFYNYALFVLGLPLSTDVVVSPGSTVFGFSVSSSTSGTAQSTAVGVNIAINNPGAIADATLLSTFLNGQTSYASSSSGSDSGSSSSSSDSFSSSYGQVNSTALIVGLVVGLVGAALLIAGSVFGYKKYQQRRRGQRLINDDSGLESPRINQTEQNNEMPTNVSKSADNEVNLTRQTSTILPSLPNLNNNRLSSPLPNATNEPRVPSAAMSITMLDALTPAHQQSALKSVPQIELIQFD